MNRFAVYAGCVLLLLLVCFAESRQIAGSDLEVSDSEVSLQRNERSWYARICATLCAGFRCRKFDFKVCVGICIEVRSNRRKRSVLPMMTSGPAADTQICAICEGDPILKCKRAGQLTSNMNVHEVGTFKIYDISTADGFCDIMVDVTIYRPDSVNYPNQYHVGVVKAEINNTIFTFDTMMLRRMQVNGEMVQLSETVFATDFYGGVVNDEGDSILLIPACETQLRFFHSGARNDLMGVDIGISLDSSSVASDTGMCSVSTTP